MREGAKGRGPRTGGHRDDPLRNFGAYTKALELFDCVADDAEVLLERPHLVRLVSQQIASADSIAANIEEGYGRGSRKEYIRFLVISRGSARETCGRYGRCRRWLPAKLVESRIRLCEEIVGILSASILSLRRREESDATPQP